MKLKNLLMIVFPSLLFSQSTFPYERSWATYFGGFETRINGVYENPSDQTLLIDGYTSKSTYGTGDLSAYYSQFVSAGSYPINSNGSNLLGKFSQSGNLLSAQYHPLISSLAITRYLVYRDQFGNQYKIGGPAPLNSPVLPPGVWLSTRVTDNDWVLAKYDENNNLIWETYLPGTIYSDNLDVDSNGNIYITGTTSWQGLGDPGTFRPDFEVVSQNGALKPNSFIVKLNAQGKKIWGTYVPSLYITAQDLYGNDLFIVGGNDLNDAVTALATPETFQEVKSSHFIAKFDGNTGQRVWGTYYGVPNVLTGAGIWQIKANSSGVYIGGQTFYLPGSYYATPGAHKQQTTDGFDLFLAKFNDNGYRIWGTYLGSEGTEWHGENRVLDLKDDKLLITGSSSGTENIATPGAFISTKPNPGYPDAFFSMFNTAGTHLFTSYYGGTFTSDPATDSQIGGQFSHSSDVFYIFGSSGNPNDIATANSHQPNIIPPPGTTIGRTGFIAKFSLASLSTSEAAPAKDLVLYNNPSDGNFSLKGTVLSKESHIINITDMSGRQIYSSPISKTAEQHFRLADQLANGNYLISVSKTDKTPVKSFKLTIKK